MPLIHDDRNLDSWPERMVVSAEPVVPSWVPMQRLVLSCDHKVYVINPPDLRPYMAGDTVRCRTCSERAT